MSNFGQCDACGKRFGTAIAEARHRHNFPALCVRNKRFTEWASKINTTDPKKPIDR